MNTKTPTLKFRKAFHRLLDRLPDSWDIGLSIGAADGPKVFANNATVVYRWDGKRFVRIRRRRA